MSGVKKFFCGRCNKQFKSKKGLKYHINKNVCIKKKHFSYSNGNCSVNSNNHGMMNSDCIKSDIDGGYSGGYSGGNNCISGENINGNDNENENDNVVQVNGYRIYKCKLCLGEYKHSSSYYRHSTNGICQKRRDKMNSKALVLFNPVENDGIGGNCDEEKYNGGNDGNWGNGGNGDNSGDDSSEYIEIDCSKGENIEFSNSYGNSNSNSNGNYNGGLYNSGNNVNITNNNITINIGSVVVNNVGDENIKYITKEIVGKVISTFSPENVIPHIIEYKNFNRSHPENKNMKMENISSKRICAKICDKPTIVDRDSFYQYSINKTRQLIDMRLDELSELDKKEQEIYIDQASLTKYKKYIMQLLKDIKQFKTGKFSRKNKYITQKKLLDNIMMTFHKLENSLNQEKILLENFG